MEQAHDNPGATAGPGEPRQQVTPLSLLERVRAHDPEAGLNSGIRRPAVRAGQRYSKSFRLGADLLLDAELLEQLFVERLAAEVGAEATWLGRARRRRRRQQSHQQVDRSGHDRTSGWSLGMLGTRG